MMALDLKAGDEVIVLSFTYVIAAEVIDGNAGIIISNTDEETLLQS